MWVVRVKFKLYVTWLKFYWNWGIQQWKDSQVIKVAFLHLWMCRYITNLGIYYPEGVSHTHSNWHVIPWISLIFEFYFTCPRVPCIIYLNTYTMIQWKNNYDFVLFTALYFPSYYWAYIKLIQDVCKIMVCTIVFCYTAIQCNLAVT